MENDACAEFDTRSMFFQIRCRKCKYPLCSFYEADLRARSATSQMVLLQYSANTNTDDGLYSEVGDTTLSIGKAVSRR